MSNSRHWSHIELIVTNNVLIKIEEKHNVFLNEVEEALEGFVLETVVQNDRHKIIGQANNSKILKIVLGKRTPNIFKLLTAYVSNQQEINTYNSKRYKEI